MKFNHLVAITRKELYHILREPATLITVTLGPLLLLVVFVYMLTADVRDVAVAVVNHADNAPAADLIDRLDAAPEIRIVDAADVETVNAMMDEGSLRAAIVLPEGYGEFSVLSLLGGSLPRIEIIIDGTEPTSAERVMQAAYDVTETHLRELATAAFENIPGFDSSLLEMPVEVTTERRYNPDLRPVVDFYSGLAAMMLSLPGIALVVAITREHELGTMEQLVATPVSRLALMVGKVAPYLLFGMVSAVIILVAGDVLYDVPFRGNVLEYLVVTFFFLFSNMGLGLLISVFLRSQQVAMIVAMLVFFIPGFFLSGIFFPLWVMPWMVQIELLMLPITHYVTLSKAMYLQGASLGSLWLNAAALVVLGVVIMGVAVTLFRKKVA